VTLIFQVVIFIGLTLQKVSIWWENTACKVSWTNFNI